MSSSEDRAIPGPSAAPVITGNMLPVLWEFLTQGRRRVPSRPLPVVRPHDAWRRPIESGLRATWLGHSTVLLELGRHRVLTDPVFAERASPFPFVGPRRFHPVPATLDELPPLDAVIVSHDHYDHLCAESIRRIAAMRVPIVTSRGVGPLLARLGVLPDLVHELGWGESVDLRGLRLTATPAQHFFGRGPFDRNRSLWSSWVLEAGGQKVFFSGDTGIDAPFREIGLAHGPFDLVLLEIGAYHEAWSAIHLGPAHALEALHMLGGGPLLPVHWGTFDLAVHAWDEPAETLVTLAAQQGARVLTPRLGEVFEPAHLDGPTPWWRGL
jgi:L-ascorbate metabolism protein UlaG (beta-lactamase superfamily)